MKGLKLIVWLLALSLMLSCACFVSFAAEGGESGGGNIFIHILIALAIGFIIALIVTGVMKSKLKSVRPNNAAANYTRDGSFDLAESREIFLYTETKQTRKQKDEDKN